MTLPPMAGIGFRPQHFQTIRATAPRLGFFEIHAENFMGAGGLPYAQLTALRQDYALLLHGVGLSIGGADDLDRDHLARLRALCDRYEPDSFFEHLAWSSHGGDYLNDLLPLPYTEETLAIVCAHVAQVHDVLGRRMLLENPSIYVLFAQSTIPETAFLAEIVGRTGCGLLLDVNNVFVCATNHRTDAGSYLADFPFAAVGDLHLGGHSGETLPSGPLLIDAHGAPIADPVWALCADVLARTGPMATLIEWDNDVPDWPVLQAEADRAQTFIDSAAEVHLARAS